MKRIDAIIRPDSLDSVKDRLMQVGVEGLSVTEILGFGRQKGHTAYYRGNEYRIDLLPKLLLTILVLDDQVMDIVDAIIGGARTGKIGDGKVFVSPLEEVIRIRTGELNQAAV